MEILKQMGEPLNIDDKERHLLFTLNVIDEIQEHYDKLISDVLSEMLGESEEQRRKSYSVLRYVVTALVNEDVEIHNEASEDKWQNVTEEYIGRRLNNRNYGEVALRVIRAFQRHLPESDDNDPNQTTGQ